MNVELIEKMLKTYSVGGSGANTAVIYLFFSSLINIDVRSGRFSEIFW